MKYSDALFIALIKITEAKKLLGGPTSPVPELYTYGNKRVDISHRNVTLNMMFVLAVDC